jgi:alpha-1,6-mannosyltransferase
MLIAQVANFYGPSSGGLRQVVTNLGAGYRQMGHQRLLIVPGEEERLTPDPHGLTVQLPSVRLGASGYRVIVDRRRLRQVLEHHAPDRVEVSDKATMWWVGTWARRRGVPSVLFSHEVLRAMRWHFRLSPAQRFFDTRLFGRIGRRWNKLWVRSFDRVVCPSRFAARELAEAEGDPQVVPLGVDLDVFTPSLVPAGPPHRLVWTGRFSREKRPEVAVEVLRRLREEGFDAHLTMAGDGPTRPDVMRQATGLPVRFTGFVSSRSALARLMAEAHVALVTTLTDTFCLAALESLACGVPVVCTGEGAPADVITPACGVATGTGAAALAEGAAQVLTQGGEQMRVAARRRAEEFPWRNTVAHMARVHGLSAVV